MGSFGPALVDIGKQVISDIPKEDIAQLTTRLLKPLGKAMSETEPGKDLVNILEKKYIPMYHQTLTKLTDVEKVKPTHLQEDPFKLKVMARNAASNATLGQNHAVPAALIKAIENQGGDVASIHLKQQNLANNLHMFLHDTANSPGLGDYSVSKRNIRLNKEYDLKHINIESHYQKVGKIEQKLTSYASSVQAPMIWAPHLGTVLNIARSSPAPETIKALAQILSDGKNIRAITRDSGIYASTTWDAYMTRWKGSRGIVAKLTGSPEFGAAVASITHQPLFNYTREWMIALGAATGKLTAERMASDLFDSGGVDKRAIYELKRMGLDPGKVMANRGQLDQDMMKAAIFHFVDSKIFLDNSLQRPFYSRANFFTRMGTMYHSYITRQAAFEKEEFMKMAKVDRSLIPRYIAAMATLPTIGLGLKSLEMSLRGQWNESHPIEDVETLYGKHGLRPAALEWLDGFSHLAGFGIFNSIVRNGSRHELSAAILGPVANVPVRFVEDNIIAGVQKFQGKKANVKPIFRDLVEDSLGDNLGKIIAHQFIPTTTEENKRHPKFSKHIKGFGFKRLH